VLTSGTTLATIGIGVGLVLGHAMAHAISSLGLLYRVSTADLAIFLQVSLLL
jgi:hypothetical protein